MATLSRRKTTFAYIGFILALTITLIVLGLGAPDQPVILRMATTTSVENSGLLDYLLGPFEEQTGIRVDYIAVGSGQAIALGERGDVDLVLSHAPTLEEEFVASGNGMARIPVMVNDFIILGPEDDPASIRDTASGKAAFERIRNGESTFISRGDNSGTHLREQTIWQDTSGIPDSNLPWYISSGQGMGASLQMANELGGYILSDRGTYTFQAEILPNLVTLFGGGSTSENPDPKLMNHYSLIAVNPVVHSNINHLGASKFIEWMTSISTQERIYLYGRDEFGFSLFVPNSDNWNMALQNGSVNESLIEQQTSAPSAVTDSASQITRNDDEIIQIVLRTLQVSGISLLLACLAGIPIGTAIGMLEFRFKRYLQILIYTGMGLPPVVVGLATFLILSNQGIWGGLNWLFTVKGMILAQTVLAFPLASGLTITAVEAVPPELILQVRALGATAWQERWAVLQQARRGLLAAVLAALGRIIAEVGSVMLVGGNIAGQTRVLSTAIVLETRQGSFGFALALGAILLGIALLSNAIVIWLGGRWPR